MGIETSDRNVEAMLRNHPKVGSVILGSSDLLTWEFEGRRRSVLSNRVEEPLFGLIELMDNNPMVCADRVSVPSAIDTLALIALGPLIEAGILSEGPTMMVNVPTTDNSADPALLQASWGDGMIIHSEPVDLSGVIAATVIAAIETPADLTDIDALYDERYSRSVFVRRDETSAWDTSLVSGKNHAVYRLRIAADSPHSLLTIQLMADQNGKCGAAQLVHAFNVMCGYEESFGLI